MAQNVGQQLAGLMIKGVWQALLVLLSAWYIWVLFAVLIAVRVIPALIEKARLRKAGMPEIDRMTGLEFEKYLEILFKRLGYHVQRTPYVGDQGGDLVLERDGERILVQAKRYSKRVGNKAVQEAAAARPHYQCHRAMVVSNQEFTGPTKELAASNKVELWGRRKLTEVVLSLNAAPRSVAETSSRPAPKPQSEAAAGARTSAVPAVDAVPTCQRCGRSMVLRESARGKFWGCSGFPRCRNIVPLDSQGK